jgi:serine/threonine protein phosphatase PrpC
VSSSHFPDMPQALKDAFLRTDADFLQQAMRSERKKDSLVGSAAVVVMATGHQLIMAHAGDCRAVLVRREGAAVPFEELTSDHSAEESAPGAGLLRPDEAQRIAQVGATVADGFVNVGDRTVPMTRALGNMNLKVAHGRDLRCVIRPLARKAPPSLWSHLCARACVAGARVCTSRS